MEYFTGKVSNIGIFDWPLTNSADEWDKLTWWQKVLVRLGLRRAPLGQVEALWNLGTFDG
jgi:hypothetical protein